MSADRPKLRHRLGIKVAGAVLLTLVCAVLSAAYVQFRGGFTPTAHLTMMTSRAGLLMDIGSRVTYNGAPIGRVAKVALVNDHGSPKAKVTLDVAQQYLSLIPANVDASITASTVFGNKYVSLLSPKQPTAQHISSENVIDATAVTTEFNTVFETIMQISEKVDPVKLNATLTATGEALQGLGTGFGHSIRDGNNILAELNSQMPQIRHDLQGVADLEDVYTKSSPQLWSFLKNAVTTARTLDNQQTQLTAALMAAVGFGDAGADILDRGAPYLVRAVSDLVPTAQLLDTYSPQIYCMVRNYHDVVPALSKAIGGNGYSVDIELGLVGAENPYVYPDNLPRVNARGGPAGSPGCWAPITRDLWPAPTLVMDSGNSVAPYNHFTVGQPVLTDYVWGRQVGENTINP
jgi:phospholipid/cholesterol/gamma-HCH transport system substrate-binding protein